MELQLKNIGMIKEANVKIDGLTVIAGENDTGKSTVGKALYFKLQFLEQRMNNLRDKKNMILGLSLPSLLFKGKLISNKSIKAFIKLIINKEEYNLPINHENVIDMGTSYSGKDKLNLKKTFSVLFIETPLVWNFTDFFRDIAQIESQMRIELDYPYLMKDLNFKLHIKSASNGLDIKKEMTDLMGGEFKKDEMGRYYFDKQGERIELLNTATGIKMFGIFQVLSQNNYLNENTILILDEPEVHLHPKWQLEMAKIIVELVKNGVKVLVNSHSPYMIEALKRYSEVEEIEDKTNFYLAEDGYIKKENDSNSETLAKIFEKLSEPFDVFEEMDMERLLNV